MKLATFRYLQGAWSEPFPDLDSERTLVIAFAAPSYGERPELFGALTAAYPRSAVIGSRGHDVNGSELIRGLNAKLADHVIVTGGLAGDGDRFGKTFVIAGGKPQRDAVGAIGLSAGSPRRPTADGSGSRPGSRRVPRSACGSLSRRKMPPPCELIRATFHC